MSQCKQYIGYRANIRAWATRLIFDPILAVMNAMCICDVLYFTYYFTSYTHHMLHVTNILHPIHSHEVWAVVCGLFMSLRSCTPSHIHASHHDHLRLRTVFSTVIFSADWHPADHYSFVEAKCRIGGTTYSV